MKIILHIQIISIILITFPFNTLSQGVSDLDSKNGFKNFILGDKYWEYSMYELRPAGKNKIQDHTVERYEVKQKYTPFEDKTFIVGNMKMTWIFLTFYDNELFKVEVYVKATDFKTMYDLTVKKYGTPSIGGFAPPEEKYLVKYDNYNQTYYRAAWNGQKIQLSFKTEWTNAKVSPTQIGFSDDTYQYHIMKFINESILDEITKLQGGKNNYGIDDF